MTLYELAGQYFELQAMIESGEFDEQTLADTLEGLEGEIEAKADGYARVIRNLEASAEAYKNEAERFAAKRRACENGVKRLKEFLRDTMIALDKEKIKTELFDFSVRNNGGSLPVILDIDENDLPDDLKIFSSRPNMKAIAERIEAGTFDGAHFGERGKSLVIK